MSYHENELKSIGIEVNDLLGRYIKIHDAVFPYSSPKLMRLQFIFIAMDFKELNNQAKQILSELETCQMRSYALLESTRGEEREVAEGLTAYCSDLLAAVSLLKKILFLLYLKIQNPNEFSFSEYQRKYNSYKETAEHCGLTGALLNYQYPELIHLKDVDVRLMGFRLFEEETMGPHPELKEWNVGEG